MSVSLPFGFPLKRMFIPPVVAQRYGQFPDVGNFVNKAMGPMPATRRVPIECPYCHELLEIAPGYTAGRIVALEGDKAEGLTAWIDPLEATHEAVFCRPCVQVFTVLSWPLRVALGGL